MLINIFVSLSELFVADLPLVEYYALVAKFVIHYLFLQRINDDLTDWRRQWNEHKLRTEHHMSPNQFLARFQERSAAEPILLDAFPCIPRAFEKEVEDVPGVVLGPLISFNCSLGNI